jgi:hypothetical protein
MLYSPFQALYDYEPNVGVLPDLTNYNKTDTSVAEMLQEHADHITMLKTQLVVAQICMKIQAAKKRVDRTFQVGEQVLLKIQPYAQHSVNRPYPKLAYKYFGHLTVQERIGSVAYKLELPSDARIHNIFHVSQLKPFIPNYSPVYFDITKLVDLSTVNTEPEAILDHRLVKKGSTLSPKCSSSGPNFQSLQQPGKTTTS